MLFNSVCDDIKWQFKFGTPLIKLIFINVAVFLLINLMLLFTAFSKIHFVNNCIDYSSFTPTAKIIYQPLSIITYQFTHISFWHILFNMLWLFWMGNIWQDFLGNKKTIPLYLLGGIAGAILYAVFYYIIKISAVKIPIATHLQGASAGVMAIVFGVATLSPNYEIRMLFLGNVKIKWIAIVFLVLDIIMLTDGNMGGHLSHIGGAIFGWFYVRQLRNGKDIFNYYYTILDYFSFSKPKKSKLKVSYVTPQKQKVTIHQQPIKAGTKQQPVYLSKKERQEQLDAILDKINSSGYESLSQQEKDFLFQISKED